MKKITVSVKSKGGGIVTYIARTHIHQLIMSWQHIFSTGVMSIEILILG